MMDIECPKCGEFCGVDEDYLPDCAHDDQEFICSHCKHKFMIGWYAVAEVRDDCL